jgi:4-hydroxy-4-methyl-2-oxoglutarate aldolase
MNERLIDEINRLSTPHLTDACLRTGVPIRCAPVGLRPIVEGMRCAGRARPVRHVGSVDVFLEAVQGSAQGEVLVIDNGGRLDEACVGDLITLEVEGARMAGIVIWGLHRDSHEIREIGFPLFSLGALPNGPQRLDARPADVFGRATVGAHVVTLGDFVVADANGVIFLPEARLDDVMAAAVAIRDAERRQLDGMGAGRSYRTQVRFNEYMSRRDRNAGYNFRQHLRDIEAAGEV